MRGVLAGGATLSAALVAARWYEAARIPTLASGIGPWTTILLLAVVAMFGLGWLGVLAGAIGGAQARRPEWILGGLLLATGCVAAFVLVLPAEQAGVDHRFRTHRREFEALSAKVRTVRGLHEISVGGSLNGVVLPDAPVNDPEGTRSRPPLHERTRRALASTGIDSVAFRRLHDAMRRLGLAQVEVTPEGVLFRSFDRVGWVHAARMTPALRQRLRALGDASDARPVAPGWFVARIWTPEDD